MSAVNEDKCSDDTVAVVLPDNNKIISTDNSIAKVIAVNDRKSTVLFLLDTGKPNFLYMFYNFL